MDCQTTSVLSWAYFCQGKTLEELRHSLISTTLELEQTKMAVQEEIRKRDEQMFQLKEMLCKAIKERDDAEEQCQKLVLEKIFLQQQQIQQQNAPLSGVSSVEDEPRRGIESNNGFSSSDCDESIVSSPVVETALQQPAATTVDVLVPEKPLPEKGKLLQAVMKAGPLLQTLLLAGPLPQWRHPPPPLESFEIPPVTIPSPPPPPPHQDSPISCNRKRGLIDGSNFPTETKYQRIALH